MTQTASQPAPAPQSAGATAVTGRAANASVVPSSSGFTENVPRLLNRIQTIGIVACVLFGALAATVQLLGWQANGRAAENTEQVVRAQEIQSLLLRADAVATNAFLVGGLEPPAARAEYDETIEKALRLVADAAEAQPADRQVLADLNATISDYTTSVAQARDNNRQQFPIGIAYLNDAGTLLRAEALPMIQAVVDANSERAVDEMDAQHPWWLIVLTLLTLAVLIWLNQQVSRRFRRRVNAGLAIAALIVAILGVATAIHAGVRNDRNDALRDGAYRDAVDAATARTAANDAKALESQGLINRGSGATYEAKWDEQAAAVDDSGVLGDLWQQYVAAHQQVRDLDDAGDWEKAVELATSTADEAPTAVLNRFDTAAAERAANAGAEASDGFGSGDGISLALIVVTILGALAAAGAVTRGIDVRRKEYF
ncbi:hypothetical protein [Nocardioides sp. GXZ039]|uniref:hypothetical protein n=1 Tax=Nocardioides sp. GXZ039 TaxID=3136018 RepID=UPI0030F3919C